MLFLSASLNRGAFNWFHPSYKLRWRNKMDLGPAENDRTAYLPVRSLVPIIEAVRAETASSTETHDCTRLGTEIEKALKNTPLAFRIFSSLSATWQISFQRLAAKLQSLSLFQRKQLTRPLSTEAFFPP